MEHYYSPKPQVKTHRQSFKADLVGRTFHFYSDAGVFSKQAIDYGSRVLVDALVLNEGARVLDVGCGYGPIGLAAATIVGTSGHVTMVDVNERAIELAKLNAEANSIRNVSIGQSYIYEEIDANERFDSIVTNPPIRAGKEVVHRILIEGFEYLLPGGELWAVIQKKQGAPSSIAKLQEVFGEDQVSVVKKDKGYYVIKAQKLSKVTG